MIDRNEYDPIVEKIHKTRKKISKKIENMSLQERNDYLNKETADFYKIFKDYKDKVKLEQSILDYYKSTYGSSYLTFSHD